MREIFHDVWWGRVIKDRIIFPRGPFLIIYPRNARGGIHWFAIRYYGWISFCFGRRPWRVPENKEPVWRSAFQINLSWPAGQKKEWRISF